MFCAPTRLLPLVLFLATLVLCTHTARAQEATRTNPEEMKKKADAAMALGDSMEGIEKAQDLLDYADLLYSQGKEQEAAKYLDAGIRKRPWALTYQVMYANILRRAGKAKDAAKLAEFVAGQAEDDKTRLAALRLLGKDPGLALPPYATVPGDGLAIVIVPIGTVDVSLLLEVAKDIRDRLGIPVQVEEAHVLVPQPKRDAYADYLREMRGKLMESANDPSLGEELKAHKMTLSDLERDEALESFSRDMVSRKMTGEQYRQWCGKMDSLKINGKQWNTDDLHSRLEDAVVSQQRKNVFVFGVTSLDIYARDWNYVFSICSSTMTRSVLSYCRYCAAFSGEAPERSRLAARLRKLCLSNFAHLCDVERCSDPKCLCAFQNSLQEHDAKTENYCPACLAAVEAKLGHAVKPASAPAQAK